MSVAMSSQEEYGGYPLDVVRAGRMAWVYGFCADDAGIAAWLSETRGIEVTREAVVGWRRRNGPDGTSWEEERGLVGSDGRGERWLGVESEIAMRLRVVNGAQRLWGVLMAALEVGQLYDKEGEKVGWLYDRDGRKVKVGGLMPTTMGQVTTGLSQMAALLGEQAEELGRLEELAGVREREMKEKILELCEVMGPTDEQRAQVTAFLSGGGEDGAEGEGEGKEAEAEAGRG